MNEHFRAKVAQAFLPASIQSGSMADDFSFHFSTKYFDPETGFYYYGYRYYEKGNQNLFKSSIKDGIKGLADGQSIVIYDYWDNTQRASVRKELYYASGTFTVTSYGVFLLKRKGGYYRRGQC